jgi:hypothetical protein
MLLRITDGTETVTLSGDGVAILGAAYMPRPPKDALTPVAEDARVIIEGTAAQIVAATQAMERLFAVARGEQSHNLAIYVEHQREGDTVVWRSQIYDGRLLWSDDPIRRQLQAGVTAVEVVASWERAPWLETTDEADGGTVYMHNGGPTGSPAIGDWIGPGGPATYSAAFSTDEGDNAYNAGEWANIEGVLPTPAHLTLTNASGASVTAKRLFIANDIYARFNGAQHQLASAAAITWTGASTHATQRWTLTPTTAQIAKAVASGGVRLLAVMTTITAGVYLRATLQQNTAGSVLVETWRGPEVLTASTRKVYDLGFLPMPPDALTFTDWRICISVYAAASGGGTLDFVQLCPGRELIVLEAPTALAWGNGAAIDWYGEDRYASIIGYHGSMVAAGLLLLQPQRYNRLQVLVESSSGVDSTAAMTLQVRYRPRRATI